MLAPTHMIGGQFAYLTVAWWVGHEPALPEALLAAAAALFPDIDSRGSVPGRFLPWLSGSIEHWVGHRTATHSVLALAIVVAIAWFLPSGYGLALVAGFASHAALDMMTPSGVSWFWPARARCVLPGNVQWRMEPMGKGELAFAVILAALTWPTLLAADRGVGLLGTVRDTIGNVAEARRHYDAHKSEAAWWLKIEGQDNLAFQPIEGRHRIIGPYRTDGLIVDTDDGPRSVCRADACDWYARRAVLERGQPERTTIRKLTAGHTSVAGIVEALAPLEAAGRVYLVGDLVGEGIRDDEPTIMRRADGAALRYAPLARLARQEADVAQADLTVQVRHPPGAEVPAIGKVREHDRAAIDSRLRRYLP